MFGDKRVEKKKTPVYKCNLNPIFNAAFDFDVPWEQIRDCALDVQVMDFDTVGRNELIGKLTLGCACMPNQCRAPSASRRHRPYRTSPVLGLFLFFLKLYVALLPFHFPPPKCT